MKLDTVSVAPPGPPDVTLMTMSASFSLKIMRMTIAVTLTGSISGKVICQKPCQGPAPSTFAASCTSLGKDCSPATSRIITKGIETQASIASIQIFAQTGSPKKDGVCTPIQRTKRETGPKRVSSMDLPIIQLTATGDSMKGRRKVTRQNLRALTSALSISARQNAIAYSNSTAQT